MKVYNTEPTIPLKENETRTVEHTIDIETGELEKTVITREFKSTKST